MKYTRTLPLIEVPASRKQPLGMSAKQFLRSYWQKHPLLIRGGFPQVGKAISADDLAGLSCEEGSLARIVLHDPQRDRYTLRNGPFAESDFAKLPKTHWTLLVQDVDKWDMDVAALLDAFAFVPSWRVDDVMVSYATDGGGVGAHVDQYDVFLVQGRGRRRWRISTDVNAPIAFRDDSELKLLRSFVPSHDWILEPGDALYLPPRVAHEGTAIDECMTLSVGMRAPSHAEMLLDFSEFLAEPLHESLRYADADLAPTLHAGEIDSAALARVRTAMPHFSSVDNFTLAQWFGTFITRYRAANDAAPNPRPLTQAKLAAKLSKSVLLRNPWSRVAWTRHAGRATLFVAGNVYHCPLALTRKLSAAREISGSELLGLVDSDGIEILTALVNAGHWALSMSRRKTGIAT